MSSPDATAIVLEWLTHHPHLRNHLKPGAERDAHIEYVRSLIFPYDKFPATLDALIRLALEQVDWDAVVNGPKGDSCRKPN